MPAFEQDYVYLFAVANLAEARVKFGFFVHFLVVDRWEDHAAFNWAAGFVLHRRFEAGSVFVDRV
jgi:hypothetical protein